MQQTASMYVTFGVKPSEMEMKTKENQLHTIFFHRTPKSKLRISFVRKLVPKNLGPHCP